MDPITSARALPPPATAVTPVTADQIDAAAAHARASPRQRVIVPFHKSADARLHRMLNALQPGTYIQPHRHLNPPKAESIVVLRGAIRYFVFDDAGAVTETHVLRAGGPTFGIDTDAGVFHTFVALQPDTVLFEVKPGPYSAADDKDFAAWAPPEGNPGAGGYLADLTARL